MVQLQSYFRIEFPIHWGEIGEIGSGGSLRSYRWNDAIYNKNNNIQIQIINGNGKVKEYDIRNRLIFECEYINGEKKE